jgi:uncharacterized protein Yka (UPF0111/DUF47 family)
MADSITFKAKVEEVIPQSELEKLNEILEGLLESIQAIDSSLEMIIQKIEGLEVQLDDLTNELQEEVFRAGMLGVRDES